MTAYTSTVLAGFASWIIDNADPGFSASGNWNASTRDPGYWGADYLWHAAGDGDARATWRMEVPQPGLYNVYARWVYSKPDDRATDAPFTVKGRDRHHTIRVNMAEEQFAAEHPAGRVQSSWNLLGTFQFDGEAVVTLSNDANQSVVADAIRFEYMAPAGWMPPGRGDLLYEDDFATLDNWFVEGSGTVEREDNPAGLRVVSDSNRIGIHAWYKHPLPDNVRIEWDVTFHGPRGFALVFFSFAAVGEGIDFVYDLPVRTGRFPEYVDNPAVRGYHLSFHRMGTRRYVGGANLNKNPGKHLVQRNAVGPAPPLPQSQTYRAALIQTEGTLVFLINEQPVLFFHDRGEPHGGGYFGFRQIYHSDITYRNLRVFEALAVPAE